MKETLNTSLGDPIPDMNLIRNFWDLKKAKVSELGYKKLDEYKKILLNIGTR